MRQVDLGPRSFHPPASSLWGREVESARLTSPENGPRPFSAVAQGYTAPPIARLLPLDSDGIVRREIAHVSDGRIHAARSSFLNRSRHIAVLTRLQRECNSLRHVEL